MAKFEGGQIDPSPTGPSITVSLNVNLERVNNDTLI